MFSQTQWNTQLEEWNTEAIAAAGDEIHKLLVSLVATNYELLKFHPAGGGSFRLQLFDVIQYVTTDFGTYG